GRYMEDNDYKGDLGLELGEDFDLNEYNARFSVTPEFPDGSWAYYVCIDAIGEPVYPYNIGRSFFGDPVGGVPTGIPDNDENGARVTTVFEGGPEAALTFDSVSVDDSDSGDLTIIWNSVEGSRYEVSQATDVQSSNWTVIEPQILAQSDQTTLIHEEVLASKDRNFYRAKATGLAPFDDEGFMYEELAAENIADQTLLSDGGIQTVWVQLSSADSSLVPEDLSAEPTLVHIGELEAVFVSRISRYILEVSLNQEAVGVNAGPYTATINFGFGEIASVNSIIVPDQANNILLLIIDDWAVDSSPLDNSTILNPGTSFPEMETLRSLAGGGVRFTNGYSQPVCSPMRACILTGRQAWRTGVGSPGDSLLAEETTLPEVFAAANSPYALGAFGKWHLGGGNTGFRTLGAWPHFVGITGGGVNDYYSWRKNNNGTVSISNTYTTSDQVNEALTFIDEQETADKPWFVWMGFNAAHTPFHEPPSELLQGGEGTDVRSLYEKALEALDTEIGRLLTEMGPAVVEKTNIIVVGDNGTPGRVAQAPYGNGHAKGSIYEGGIHVPFIIKGPDVSLPAGSTSDRFVHVIDIFPTILELADVSLPGTGVDATSILPILKNNDTASRRIVTERFNSNKPGRSLREETYPDYKLLIYGDPFLTTDTPTYEFYHLPSDVNEKSPLDITNLNPVEQAAFDALIARDAALGGGYSAVASGLSN
ncbi:MAG TPA: hypothetical protein EYG38_04410, partial [Verrucomicrobia bacterium]|nr:hypothetical protein [Verrucomicrobiota bacterium]